MSVAAYRTGGAEGTQSTERLKPFHNAGRAPEGRLDLVQAVAMVAQVTFDDALFLEHLLHHAVQVFVLDTGNVDQFSRAVTSFALPTLITPPALVCHDEVASKTRAHHCTTAGGLAASTDAASVL